MSEVVVTPYVPSWSWLSTNIGLEAAADQGYRLVTFKLNEFNMLESDIQGLNISFTHPYKITFSDSF